MLSLKVYEEVENENCIIKIILYEWHYDHLCSDINKTLQILLAS